MSLIPKHFINAVAAIGVQQNCNSHLEKVWIGNDTIEIDDIMNNENK